jgi:hypothetical protein
MKFRVYVLLFSALAYASIAKSAEKPDNIGILFDASGQTTIGVHVLGKNRFQELAPGYRADFLIYTDIISYKKFVFDFLAGATTSIARLPDQPIKMDKIKYVLVPSIRYPFRKTLVNVQLLHECIHTISREETSGSAWWNSIQAGGGTKGAYHYHFIEKYNSRELSLRNSFDFKYTLGVYLHGKAELIGNNHDYIVDGTGLLRYHLGLFRNQTIFLDLSNHLWIERDRDLTSKTSVEINWVILARCNIATIFCGYCIQDDNPFDNEANLLSIGFRAIF